MPRTRRPQPPRPDFRKLFAALPKSAQGAICDVTGDDPETIMENMWKEFSPEHPYFSVSCWGSGFIVESHPNAESVEKMAYDACTRGDDERFTYEIFNREGKELKVKITCTLVE